MQQNNLEQRHQAIKDSLSLTASGYAGVDRDGKKVDRRLFPDAVPMQKNTLLGIPYPKIVSHRKIYISGKISGLPMEDVIKKFDAAEAWLRDNGWLNIVNPLKIDHSNNPCQVWEIYMKADIKELVDCECIALLPCWHESAGAIVEFYIAQKLSYPVILLNNLSA